MQKLSVTWYPLLIIYLFIYLVLSVTWYQVPLYTSLATIFFLILVLPVPKIVSIFNTCVPIFGNVDGSWRVTSKLRDSTLIQVARRCSKMFQRFSASLVRVGDVQDVSRRHAVRGKKEHTRLPERSVTTTNPVECAPDLLIHSS